MLSAWEEEELECEVLGDGRLEHHPATKKIRILSR